MAHSTDDVANNSWLTMHTVTTTTIEYLTRSFNDNSLVRLRK